MMDVKATVTVIIPTHERPEDLCLVFQSYLQPEVSAVVVVDDCSRSDYSAARLHCQRLADDHGISLKWLRNVQRSGVAATRNRGLKEVRTELLLWGEDDLFLDSNYIRNLARFVDESHLACGCIYYGVYPGMPEGDRDRVIRIQHESPKPIFNYKAFEGYYRKPVDGPLEVPFGHAITLARTSAYNHVKFNEAFRGNGYREESDAQLQMFAQGIRCLYVSSAICYHLPRKTGGGQHTGSRVGYELNTLVNNVKFFFRNRKVVSEINHGRMAWIKCLAYFSVYRFSFLASGALRKLRRRPVKT